MSVGKQSEFPKPPRGLRPAIRREWFRMCKALADQGIEAGRYELELVSLIGLFAEKADLESEWDGANLREKLALGRRFGAIDKQRIQVWRGIVAGAKAASA